MNVTIISQQVICDACSGVTLAKEKYAEGGDICLCHNSEEKHVPGFFLFGKTDPGLIWHDHISTQPLINVKEGTIPGWSACKFYLFATRFSFASIVSVPARPLPDSI